MMAGIVVAERGFVVVVMIFLAQLYSSIVICCVILAETVARIVVVTGRLGLVWCPISCTPAWDIFIAVPGFSNIVVNNL